MAAEVRGRADELIQEAVSDVDLEQGLPGIDLKKGLGDIHGKKDAEKGDQDESKSADELRDKAKDLTEGLFGKKKKKKDEG